MKELTLVLAGKPGNINDELLGASLDSGINGSESPVESQSSLSHSERTTIICNEEIDTRESDNLVEEIYIDKDSISKAVSESHENERNSKFQDYDVVVAIDIGTTFTGYAFAHLKNPSDNQIHIMRQSHGGDKGLNNQKVPTVLLLTPDKKFSSFGYTARDHYYDLESEEAKNWLYFDKFKINGLTQDIQIHALNGQTLSALIVFSETLKYLKDQVYKELRDQGSKTCLIRWVITVPALWEHEAKNFMYKASSTAGLGENVIIALEPEAASICCRQLHFDQIIKNENKYVKSASYMVVDCGGGTVDITVHIDSKNGNLKEIYKAKSCRCGSLEIDEEFIKLLCAIFGSDYIKRFKHERIGAYNDILLSFESRKRSATTFRDGFFNIFLPYAFIDFYRQVSGSEVEKSVRDYGRSELSWSNEGVLKIHSSLMYQFFEATIKKIVQEINDIILKAEPISYLFLVGGFSESQILQETIKHNFSNRLNIIIPQAVSLSVLKGGVLYGINPSVISCRRVTHTYGLGVVKPFLDGIHPIEKLVIRNGQRWCVDVLERLIESGQPVPKSEIISKTYTPAYTNQSEIVLQIYATVSKTAEFITDTKVYRCGQIKLQLSKHEGTKLREIVVSLLFGDNVTASALDTLTGNSAKTILEFII